MVAAIPVIMSPQPHPEAETKVRSSTTSSENPKTPSSPRHIRSIQENTPLLENLFFLNSLIKEAASKELSKITHSLSKFINEKRKQIKLDIEKCKKEKKFIETLKKNLFFTPNEALNAKSNELIEQRFSIIHPYSEMLSSYTPTDDGHVNIGKEKAPFSYSQLVSAIGLMALENIKKPKGFSMHLKVGNATFYAKAEPGKIYLIKELNKIGQGSYGSVHRVWEVASKQFAALKIARSDFDTTDKSLKAEDKLKDEITMQININKNGENPGIQHRPITDLMIEQGERIVAVLIKLYEMDLFDWLTKINPTKEQRIDCCKKLVSAAVHLKKLNVWHGDIKLDNILLDYEGNFRICDLADARFLNEQSESFENGSKTPLYLHPYDVKLIDKAASEGNIKKFQEMAHIQDLFALGCVLFSVLSNSPPYPDLTNYSEYNLLKFREKINRKALINYGYTDKLTNIVLQTINHDCNKRLRINELEIEWLSIDFESGIAPGKNHSSS